MPKFDTISKTEAPAPTSKTNRKLSSRMSEYDAYVKGLKPGEVGRVTPDDTTPRGESLRIHRAAKRVGREVTVWFDEKFVYVEPTDKPSTNGKNPKE